MNNMQPARHHAPLLTMPSVEEIERVIRENLSHSWQIRIEHTNNINPDSTLWEQWGETFYAVKEPSPIIDQLTTCRLMHPDNSIRLNAEKYHPQVRFIYCVHRAQADTATFKEAVPYMKKLSTSSANDASVLGGFSGTDRVRLFKIAAIASVLLVSALVLEQMIA
jgi:ribulose bisphosphate carboxylase small subunit